MFCGMDSRDYHEVNGWFKVVAVDNEPNLAAGPEIGDVIPTRTVNGMLCLTCDNKVVVVIVAVHAGGLPRAQREIPHVVRCIFIDDDGACKIKEDIAFHSIRLFVRQKQASPGHIYIYYFLQTYQ